MFKKEFLAKFKTASYTYCIMCKNYPKCNRLRASGCYKPNDELILDVVNTYPDYFDDRKKDAIKNFKEVYGIEI